MNSSIETISLNTLLVWGKSLVSLIYFLASRPNIQSTIIWSIDINLPSSRSNSRWAKSFSLPYGDEYTTWITSTAPHLLGRSPRPLSFFFFDQLLVSSRYSSQICSRISNALHNSSSVWTGSPWSWSWARISNYQSPLLDIGTVTTTYALWHAFFSSFDIYLSESCLWPTRALMTPSVTKWRERYLPIPLAMSGTELIVEAALSVQIQARLIVGHGMRRPIGMMAVRMMCL